MRYLAHPVRTPAVVVAVVVAALFGAGAAWSTFDPFSSSPVVNAVVGGGHLDPGSCFFQNGTLVFCSAVARDFSYDAHGLAPTGAARGTALTGVVGDGNFVKTRITCMTVVGNAAVIGGYVTEAPSAPNTVGWAVWRAVTDNGGPGNASPDRVSYNLFSPPGDPTIPAGFPNKCGYVPADFGYADLLAGDVSIHSGL
jgi:hypothetical protein